MTELSTSKLEFNKTLNDVVIVLLLSFAFIRFPFGISLVPISYLSYAFFFYNFKDKKLNIHLIPFFLLLPLSFIGVIIFGKNIELVVVRTIYIAIVWLTITAIYLNANEKHFITMAIGLSILIFLDAITAKFTGNVDVSSRTYFGITIQRIMGIEGNHNYTAFPYLGLALIFFYARRYWYFVLLILITYLTGTRGGFLSFLVALLFFYLNKKDYRKLFNIGYWSVIVICVGFPYIWKLILVNVSNETKLVIHAASTFRTVIWEAYFAIIEKYPFGIGYHNGRMWGQEQRNIVPFYDQKFSWLEPFNPHSVFMQSIVEFGYLGHIMFSFFIISFGYYVWKKRRYHAPLYMFILVSWMTVLGLFFWIFILFFAIILGNLFIKKEKVHSLFGKLPNFSQSLTFKQSAEK